MANALGEGGSGHPGHGHILVASVPSAMPGWALASPAAVSGLGGWSPAAPAAGDGGLLVPAWPLMAAAQQVVQEVVGFLHRLASASKDCAAVMCHAGYREALAKALDKHRTAPSLAPALLDLVTDCEKYSSLCRKLTTSILAGCIQVGLGRPGCTGPLGLAASSRPWH